MGEERLVRFGLVLTELRQRGGEQVFEQRPAVRARLPRRVEHSSYA